jgi:two-component system chemotaxis response regulator CheB
MLATLRDRPASVGPLPRVLIVDDSAVARAVLARFVGASGRYEVAATLPDAARALAFLAAHRVDVILLDLDMPGTSGIDALPALLAAGRGARVLIVSGAAEHGAGVTMRALSLGAADTLVKPAAGTYGSRFGELLLARLDLLTAPVDAAGPASRVAAPPASPFDAVAIGASTGGIRALAAVLAALPAGADQPIFITQHLPSSFSAHLATQLALIARRPCAVAIDRGRVRAGEILIAPGDAHLVAVPLPDGQAATRLSVRPAATGNVPSVDPMFASLATIHGPRLLAIVLSGMGRDGLAGAQAVRDAGGTVVVQDRDSSVVWGMPGAVAAAGLASAVLAPAAIAALLTRNAAAQ